MVTKSKAKKGNTKISIREQKRRDKLSEKMPNSKWRFTYRDTPKGIARYDAKTKKTTYLYSD